LATIELNVTAVSGIDGDVHRADGDRAATNSQDVPPLKVRSSPAAPLRARNARAAVSRPGTEKPAPIVAKVVGDGRDVAGVAEPLFSDRQRRRRALQHDLPA
jgi:hypothetical protein